MEVLVACLILSIFIFPVTSMFFYNSRSIVETRSSDIALNLAQSGVEMQKKGINNVSLCEKYPDHRCEIGLKDISGGMHEIKVTVFYRVSGEEKELSIFALSSK